MRRVWLARLGLTMLVRSAFPLALGWFMVFHLSVSVALGISQATQPTKTATGGNPTEIQRLGKHGRFKPARNGDFSIQVDLEHVVNEVSDQFLSVTIDAGAIQNNWEIINFTSPRVVNMAKALSPAMLRVGGTSEDFIIFTNTTSTESVLDVTKNCADASSPSCSVEQHSNFTMNTTQWDTVNEFVRRVGWDFIFGLNELLRSPWPNGTWDSSDAEELMDYNTAKGYRVNWELGNEPDLYPKVAPNIPITPQQDAEDFKALKPLVEKMSPLTKYVVGPDVASVSQFLGSFLQSIGEGIINAVTWHHYYTNGHTAILPDFFDVSLLDSFIDHAEEAWNLVDKYVPDAELWLGETSSCYGGGAPVLSSAYVAGFMWLDKLGIAALVNHTRVFRQAFVGGHYSLLDSKQYPLPDFWLSVIYKKLVGTKVLSVLNSLEHGRYVRAYAHCAKSPYTSGNVVLLMLNLNTYNTNATLLNKELATSSRDVYWLTPPGGVTNITSSEVTLNGELLQLVGGTSLPDLKPEPQKASDTLFLPALSFGFHVFTDVKATACM